MSEFEIQANSIKCELWDYRWNNTKDVKKREAVFSFEMHWSSIACKKLKSKILVKRTNMFKMQDQIA